MSNSIWFQFSKEPSHNGGFLLRFRPKAKSWPFLASALYASILEPGTNEKINCGQISFRH